jgi:hypothetical protein
MGNNMTKQIKSRERVTEHGEVFTNEREVKAMCDLVKDETERIDSRFLEPACGDGNFLSEVLGRKLAVVKRKYKKNWLDYEKNAILALSSIYGIELLKDNCIACRERLFDQWNAEYSAICKKEANEDTREAARFILSRNIVCGNALTFKCADDNGNDIDEPIIFSEWAFVTGPKMQRKDYTFEALMQRDETVQYEKKVDLLGEDEGRLIKQYISHYRRIQDNG